MYRIIKQVVSFYKQIFRHGIKTFEEAESYLVNELGCKKVVMYEGKPYQITYYENGIKDEFGQIPRYVIEKR